MKHFKPTCSKITSTTHSATIRWAMIRGMGNVEVVRKRNNSESAMLRMPSSLESRRSLIALADISWLKSEPNQNFSLWRLDALFKSRTMSSERRDRVVLGTGKTEAQKEHFVAHNARKRCIKKRISMELTTVSNEIQYIVIRNSKLAGPRRSASQRINWHRKTTPTVYPLRSMREKGKTGRSH